MVAKKRTSGSTRGRRQKGRTPRARSVPVQLPLVPRGRGGFRPGAGRPRTGRTKVPHRTRPRHAARHPVHVTLRVRSDIPPLRRARLRRVLAKSFFLTFTARTGGRAFRLCHYSIQNDHLHLLVEASSTERLSRGMQGLAIRIAKRINRALDRRGTVWSERYHARPLRSPRETRSALVYVLQNGRHHPMGFGMGAVPVTCLDAASSAPWFTDWKERGIPRAPPEDEPLVTPPRTWLLREGWHKAGAISVYDAPAQKRS